jgi:hypothetical protein
MGEILKNFKNVGGGGGHPVAGRDKIRCPSPIFF